MAFTLKFNGVTMPCPSKYDFSIQRVSAGESGRTDDGVMHVNQVAWKIKISLAWAAKTPAETAAILNAAAPEYINVYFFNPVANAYQTRKFYTGDQTAPVWRWFNGHQYFESISFDIIEV